MGLAWVVIGAGLLLAVALSADVKRAVRIVVACQISRRIGTPCAELEPHVRPLKTEQWTCRSSKLWFTGGAQTSSRPLDPSRLRLFSLAGVVDILSPSIGSSDGSDLRGLRRMAQSYVGKPPISKRIGSTIRRFGVSPETSDVSERQRGASSQFD
jgi:ribosomal protein L37AE/L43A